MESEIRNRESSTWNPGSKTYMGRKIGSVISPPPRFHRFIKLWEYYPPSLPRKKKTNKDTNKKTSRKTNKTENKNIKYTQFDSKKPSETLWRMSHNFLPCCHSLIGTWLSKTWQRGVATWLCFSLIVRHAWLQLSHVISCLCWHSGMYRVTYLRLVLPVFVCIQKRSSFLKPRVSSESVPLNDFKSYNRTSNIWKHHSPL